MFECKCIYLLSRISSHLDDKGSRFLTGKENIFNLKPVPADVWFTQNSLEEVLFIRRIVQKPMQNLFAKIV